MMTYEFRWKYKSWLWNVERGLVGHAYSAEQNRMCLYFQDGSQKLIPKWSDCHLLLRSDWVAFVHKDAEKKAGQPVPLNVGE